MSQNLRYWQWWVLKIPCLNLCCQIKSCHYLFSFYINCQTERGLTFSFRNLVKKACSMKCPHLFDVRFLSMVGGKKTLKPNTNQKYTKPNQTIQLLCNFKHLDSDFLMWHWRTIQNSRLLIREQMPLLRLSPQKQVGWPEYFQQLSQSIPTNQSGGWWSFRKSLHLGYCLVSLCFMYNSFVAPWSPLLRLMERVQSNEP